MDRFLAGLLDQQVIQPVAVGFVQHDAFGRVAQGEAGQDPVVGPIQMKEIAAAGRLAFKNGGGRPLYRNRLLGCSVFGGSNAP